MKSITSVKIFKLKLRLKKWIWSKLKLFNCKVQWYGHSNIDMTAKTENISFTTISQAQTYVDLMNRK